MPTPIPWAEFDQVSLLSGEDTDDLYVLGMVSNSSNRDIAAIRLLVVLEDHEGTVIEQQEIAPALTHLAAGEASPFKAEFQGTHNALSPRVEVSDFEEGEFRRANVEVDGLETAAGEGNGWVILGRLVSSEGVFVEIKQVSLLIRDEEDMPIDLVDWEAGLTLLDPEGSTPFMARMGASPKSVNLTPYVDALQTAQEPGSSPVTLPSDPWLKIDEWQKPFIVGHVHNASPWPRWGSLVLAISFKGDLASVVDLTPPIPIPPGDTITYTLTDIPNLMAQLSRQDWQLNDLTVEAWVDELRAQPSEHQTMPLGLEITGHELIGVSLFLRGWVTNTSQQEALSPTVLASMRDSRGRTISAGWVVAGETLDPDRTIEFILLLPLPRGVSPSTCEYDLSAIGLIP
jgi:hypothetical protein